MFKATCNAMAVVAASLAHLINKLLHFLSPGWG